MLSAPVFAQPAAKPEFDVAELKLNKSGQLQMSANFLPSGQIMARNIPLKILITQAYKIRPEYLIGGPGWLDSDRFDLVGKAAPNTPIDILRVMLQTLLAERFQLTSHTEQKVMPVYALVPARQGPKLQPAAGTGNQSCSPNSIKDSKAHRTCTNVTMQSLAELLPTLAPFYFDRPVVNATEIQGSYDITLEWTVRPPNSVGAPPAQDGNVPAASDVAAGSTIFDAVEKQLGLKLESRKQPMPVIVIDHIERVTAEN